MSLERQNIVTQTTQRTAGPVQTQQVQTTRTTRQMVQNQGQTNAQQAQVQSQFTAQVPPFQQAQYQQFAQQRGVRTLNDDVMYSGSLSPRRYEGNYLTRTAHNQSSQYLPNANSVYQVGGQGVAGYYQGQNLYQSISKPLQCSVQSNQYIQRLSPQRQGITYIVDQPQTVQVASRSQYDYSQIETYYTQLILSYRQQIALLEQEVAHWKNQNSRVEVKEIINEKIVEVDNPAHLERVRFLEQELLKLQGIVDQSKSYKLEVERLQRIIEEKDASMNQQLNIANDKLRAKIQELENLQRNKRLDEEKIRDFNNQLETLRQRCNIEIDSLNGQLRQKDQIIADLERKIKEIHALLEETETTITTLQNEHQQDLGIWKNKFIESNRQFYETQEKLTLTEAELQDIRKRFNELQGMSGSANVRKSITTVTTHNVNQTLGQNY